MALGQDAIRAYLIAHPSASNADVRRAMGIGRNALARMRRRWGLPGQPGRRTGLLPLSWGNTVRAVLSSPGRAGADLARELGISRQRVHTIRRRARTLESTP